MNEFGTVNASRTVTVHGIFNNISQLSMSDYMRWGEYWRFTPQSIERIFEKYFDRDQIRVSYYGNIKTVTAFLWGLCAEDLEDSDYKIQDEQYAMLVAVAVKKSI